MYKNKRLKVLFLTLICSLLFLFPTNTTALEVGDVVLEDWEDYNLGVTSGTGTYGNWYTDDDDAGDGVITTGARSGKCVYMYYNPAGDGGKFYYNITSSDFSYINKISIWFEMVNGNGITVNFKNDSGSVLQYRVANIPGNYWQARTIDTGWENIASSFTVSEDGWFNVTHVSGNLMNYSWYNSGDGTTIYEELASYTTDDWTNITQIYISMTDGNCEFYIDDIIINTNENADDSLPELTGTIVSMNGELGIHDTLIEKSNIISVITQGDVGRHGVIEIKDPDGITVYLSDVSTQKMFLRTFHKEGEYTFRIYDYNYPDGYNATSTFDVVAPIDWETAYGDGHWAEFQQTGEDCQYKVNDYFDIVYHLPYNATYNDESNYYKLLFFAMGTSSDGTHFEDENAGGYRGSTLVPCGDDVVYLQDICKVTNFGQWRIEVWDCDADDTARDELYHSSMIYVCKPVSDDSGEYYNVYTVTLNPNYEAFNRNESVEITITKTGTDAGFYFVNSPPAGYVLQSNIESEVTTFEIDFSDYDDTHLGTWKIHAYDLGGSPADFNAVTKTIRIVETESEIIDNPIFPPLDNTLGGIVGLIVTLFLTLSPLIIAGTMNNRMGSSIQIPPLTYAITGGLGVVISSIFGWFPSWTVFFIIGIGIIVIILMYLFNQKGASA